ncbi:MAG: TldD/PmbA family protein [Candidatus Zixiibacteriota bacterium]|nr:MAG: TldD/PmbA family protein [candidate division Zixibacteria bacterium]
MNKKERLELARWAISQAKKNGAGDVAANLSFSRQIEVGVRDGKLENLKESTQNSLSLNIYVDNRYSGHSTNDLRRGSLGRFVEDAVAMTRYLGEDPYRALPDPKYYEDQKKIDLKILDPGYSEITSAERVKTAQALTEIAVAQSDKILSSLAEYSDEYFEDVKVHSNGFVGRREGTSFTGNIEITIDDGAGGKSQDYEYAKVRFRKDLPAPEMITKKAFRRVMNQIGQAKMESGVYDMVVENRAAGRLLRAMAGPLGGRSLQQRSSFLEGKIGQRIGSEKFTMVDDPFVISGLGSRLFDREGMAAKRRVIIDKGILRSYYISYYYGKKLGMEPTVGTSTNLVFDYGDKSLEELVAGLQKGILVTGFIGGNSNSTTGDFSYGIVGAYVENGKVVQPVNEMNISGNFTELWNQLTEVGNDPFVYSSWRRPSLRFKDISFSGI